MKRDHIALVFLLILLIPLFFIRVKAFHDWGDDFAQYLLQASYITGEITSIPVSEVSPYGPKIKGLIFSVLLLPALWLSEDPLYISKLIVTAGMLLLAIFMYLLLVKSTGALTAFLVTIVTVYNHQFIIIKDQVLPDFWFTGVVLLAIYLYDKNTKRSIIYAMLLAGLSVGLKSAGIVLCFALIIPILTNRNHFFNTLRQKVFACIIVGTPVAIIIGAEWLLGTEKPPLAWYSLVTLSKLFSFGMLENFNIYLTGLQFFFEFEIPSWCNRFIWYTILTGFMGGLIYKFRSNVGPMEWFTVFYIALLILYPYNRDPIRFLVPLVPLVIIYAIQFYQFIFSFLGLKTANRIVFAFVVLGIFPASTRTFTEISRSISYEPNSVSSVELFQFLSSHIPEGEKVADIKPWAIAYFSGVESVPFESAYAAKFRILRIKQSSSGVFDQIPVGLEVFRNPDFVVLKQGNDDK